MFLENIDTFVVVCDDQDVAEDVVDDVLETVSDYYGELIDTQSTIIRHLKRKKAIKTCGDT